MTQHATDPRPGSWQESQLRREVIESGKRQRASWRRIDQLFDQHQQRIDALLQSEREAAREQLAAQVVADPPDEEPAGDPAGEPAAETVPAPAKSIEEVAAQSALGSEAHLTWREQHVNRDRGIFT